MRILLTGTLAICAALPAQNQGTFTIPNGFANAEAPSSSNLPWGYGATTGSRTMYAYEPRHFTTQGINYPVTLTRARFRGNGGVTYPGGGIYGLAIFKISTMPTPISTLTQPLAFAGRHGADAVEVYRGPVAVGALSGSTPNDYHVDIIFQKPFTYDPSSGSPILIELATDPTSYLGPAMGNIRIDLAAAAASGYNRMYELTSHTATMSTGTNECGVVIEFTCGMYADVDNINVASGGTQKLMIRATEANPFLPYAIFGSITGTSPGVNLLGIHIPLIPDFYTDFTLSSPPTGVFTNFKGITDNKGSATAEFKLPPALPLPIGLEFYHSVLFGNFQFASCPVTCTMN